MCPERIAAPDAQKNELSGFLLRPSGVAGSFCEDSAWRSSRTRLQLTDHRHPCLRVDLMCANYGSRRSQTIDPVAIVPMGKCDD